MLLALISNNAGTLASGQKLHYIRFAWPEILDLVNTALYPEERILIAEKIFFQAVSVELPASQNVTPLQNK